LDGTFELNEIAIQFNKLLGKDFTPIVGNEVMIIADGFVKTVSFRKAHINAVACQTNNEIKAYPVKCSVTFNDLQKFNSQLVACIEDCSKAEFREVPLFGGPI